jgi:hypothetical protein
MAGEDYTSDGSTFHETLNLVKDGEVYNFESIQKSPAPKRGLFAKLLDNVTYLQKRLIRAAPVDLPNADHTIPLTATVYRIRAITTTRTYTVTNPEFVGQSLTIQKTSGNVQDVVIIREDATIICDFDSTIQAFGSIELIAFDNSGTPRWMPKLWSGNVLVGNE